MYLPNSGVKIIQLCIIQSCVKILLGEDLLRLLAIRISLRQS